MANTMTPTPDLTEELNAAVDRLLSAPIGIYTIREFELLQELASEPRMTKFRIDYYPTGARWPEREREIVNQLEAMADRADALTRR